MDRLKKTLPELALESVMIVFSVLLALAASSWADAHKEHKLAVQARESFVQEVQANRARVMPVYRVHAAGSVGHVQCGLLAAIRFLGPRDVRHRAADARIYANDLELRDHPAARV